jgi:hypothetical protein
MTFEMSIIDDYDHKYCSVILVHVVYEIYPSY